MAAAMPESSKGFRFLPQFPITLEAAGAPRDCRTMALNRAGAILEWTRCPGCDGAVGTKLPDGCPILPHYENTEGCVPCPVAIEFPATALRLRGTVRAVESKDGHETVWIAFRRGEGDSHTQLEEALRLHLFASNLVLYEPNKEDADKLSTLWDGIGIPPDREQSWFAVMRRLKTGNFLGVIADLDAFGSLDMGFTLVKSIFPSVRILAFGSTASVAAAKASPVAADVDAFLVKPVGREALVAALRRSAAWTGW